MTDLSISNHLYDAADEAERKLPFSDQDAEHFIADFSKCEGDAEMWLHDQGIDRSCIATAEMLRAMSRWWGRDRNFVDAVSGGLFFKEMRKLAYEAWSK